MRLCGGARHRQAGSRQFGDVLGYWDGVPLQPLRPRAVRRQPQPSVHVSFEISGDDGGKVGAYALCPGTIHSTASGRPSAHALWAWAIAGREGAGGHGKLREGDGVAPATQWQ